MSRYYVSHHPEYPTCDVSYVRVREDEDAEDREFDPEICSCFSGDSKATAEKIAAALNSVTSERTD